MEPSAALTVFLHEAQVGQEAEMKLSEQEDNASQQERSSW
jgi:hypothetical protein